jgi:glycosyltransferase involved in cell wall biosynthesis
MSDSLVLPVKVQPIRKTPRHTRQSPTATKIRRLSIIIPCYNEAATISIILDKIADAKISNSIEKEIIVINDCSKDDTDLMIREYISDNPQLTICYITHPYNMGKGSAVRSGLSRATGDYVIIQDADLEYDPSEYALMLEPIETGHADVVYGSRFMGGHPHRVLFFWHTLGNKLLTFVSNIVTNMHLTDAHTCYKVFPMKLIDQIQLRETRFAFDAELNVRISTIKGLRIYEVGISYYGRTFSEGKKIRLRDAFRSVFCLVKYGMFSRLKGQMNAQICSSKNELKYPTC